MTSLMAIFDKLAGDRKGATAVEYGLVVAFVVIAAVFGISSLGNTNRNMYNKVDKALATAIGQ